MNRFFSSIFVLLFSCSAFAAYEMDSVEFKRWFAGLQKPILDSYTKTVDGSPDIEELFKTFLSYPDKHQARIYQTFRWWLSLADEKSRKYLTPLTVPEVFAELKKFPNASALRNPWRTIALISADPRLDIAIVGIARKEVERANPTYSSYPMQMTAVIQDPVSRMAAYHRGNLAEKVEVNRDGRIFSSVTRISFEDFLDGRFEFRMHPDGSYSLHIESHPFGQFRGVSAAIPLELMSSPKTDMYVLSQLVESHAYISDPKRTINKNSEDLFRHLFGNAAQFFAQSVKTCRQLAIRATY